jgi:single-stranded DNA-binding protein
MAENVDQSITKGARVVVTGRLEQHSWEPEDGGKRSQVKIIADEVGASLRYATAETTKNERRSEGDEERPHRPAPSSGTRGDGGRDAGVRKRASSSRVRTQGDDLGETSKPATGDDWDDEGTKSGRSPSRLGDQGTRVTTRGADAPMQATPPEQLDDRGSTGAGFPQRPRCSPAVSSSCSASLGISCAPTAYSPTTGMIPAHGRTGDRLHDEADQVRQAR